MDIIESTPSSYKVKVIINGIYDEVVRNANVNYHYISINSEGRLSIPGEPSLPLITKLIAIPDGADFSVSISENKWKDIIIGKLFPAQYPGIDTEKDFPFFIKDNAYSEDYIPNLFNKSEVSQWRDIRNFSLSLCPFKYYPHLNKLSILSEFEINVDFTYRNANLGIKDIFFPKDFFGLFDNLPFKALTTSNLENNNITESHVRDIRHSNDYYNYLIIVGENTGISLTNSKLKEFQKWKALKGYKTKAISTANIGNNESLIKNYIIQEYEKGVRYILFIGDSDDIPLQYVVSPYNPDKTVAGDYYYGCWGTNSAQANIPIGRFSISSLTDFENMVDKTIKYESTYTSSNNVLLVAHSELAPAPYSYQGCSEEIRQYNYNEPMYFTKAYGAAVIDSGNCATNAFVVNEINQGSHIVNYRGHASTNFWGNPYWNSSDESFLQQEIDSMSAESCSVFFCVACNTGNIEGQTCMLETFTRSNNGAVAFIGSTGSIDTDANHGYNKYLFKKLLNNGVYHIGDLNLYSHIANIGSLYNTSIAQEVAYTYICGADPTLEIWSSSPHHIGEVNLTTSNDNVTVNTELSGNYYISIVSEEGENIDSIPCSSNSCTFQRPAGNFYIAINKHNYFPYIVYFNSTDNYIQNVTFDNDAYYINSPLSIGEYVTYEEMYGNVIIRNGKKLTIENGSGGVCIEDGFECEQGAILEIK